MKTTYKQSNKQAFKRTFIFDERNNIYDYFRGQIVYDDDKDIMYFKNIF